MTTTITFGSTFTLPATGDAQWKVRDIRPRFLHIDSDVDRSATAYALTPSGPSAHYTPATGWRVAYHSNGDHVTLAAELNALDVDLPAKTDEDYAIDFRRMLGKETRSEVAPIISLAESWTDGTGIDPLDLKAHIAATAALSAAGTPDDIALFTAVYNATLDVLKAQARA